MLPETVFDSRPPVYLYIIAPAGELEAVTVVLKGQLFGNAARFNSTVLAGPVVCRTEEEEATAVANLQGIAKKRFRNWPTPTWKEPVSICFIGMNSQVDPVEEETIPSVSSESPIDLSGSLDLGGFSL